jgi:hypothetical protein
MMMRSMLFVMLLFVSCKESDSKSVASTPNAIAQLDLDGFWQYRTADYFLDGGSVVMGFINGNGEVLYVFFDFSMGTHEYRECRLQRTYNDKDAITILPGSDLERKVITLIENAHSIEVLEKFLPNRGRAIEIIKTRKLELRLVDHDEVIPDQPKQNKPQMAPPRKPSD